MTAKILTIDIERMEALIEGWEGRQFNNWIGPNRTIEPSRTICFAYRWEHEGRTKFVAEWDDPSLEQDNTSVTPGGGHHNMIMQAHALLDEADYVVGWNSKGFDVKHLRFAFYAYDLLPPSPHIDIDLMKQFGSNFLAPAKSLAYVSKMKGFQGKLEAGSKLRRQLRYATGEELEKAKRAMRRYNIRDVHETRAVYHDMLPWIKGMNLGLFNESGEMQCPNCESTNLQRRGQRPALSYTYPRYQCNDCGKWTSGTKSFHKTELVGI